jgi:hypothetical protein
MITRGNRKHGSTRVDEQKESEKFSFNHVIIIANSHIPVGMEDY